DHRARRAGASADGRRLETGPRRSVPIGRSCARSAATARARGLHWHARHARRPVTRRIQTNRSLVPAPMVPQSQNAAMTFGRAMRDHWMLDPEWAYLNHGTVGAPPRRVLARQQALRDEMEQQPSRFMLRELNFSHPAPWRATSRLREAI